MLLAGVEEAGRGPVIGPLVVCLVAIDEKEEFLLQQIGVKDSKLLSARQREALVPKIEQLATVETLVLSPREIDQALNTQGTNLNWLEADSFAKLITKVHPGKVIVDCPSQNLRAFEQYLLKRVPKGIDVVAEHKADLNHRIVGAASIVAKVLRDRIISEMHAQVGENFGSGYPSDPRTVAFLKENWERHPHLFRKTWESYKRLQREKMQRGLNQY